MEGSEHVVLEERISALFSLSPCPHSFLFLTENQRTRDFLGSISLKTSLKAFHTFPFHSRALAMRADLCFLPFRCVRECGPCLLCEGKTHLFTQFHSPFLHSHKRGPFRAAKSASCPHPCTAEQGVWSTYPTSAPMRENRKLLLGKHLYI